MRPLLGGKTFSGRCRLLAAGAGTNGNVEEDFLTDADDGTEEITHISINIRLMRPGVMALPEYIAYAWWISKPETSSTDACYPERRTLRTFQGGSGEDGSKPDGLLGPAKRVCTGPFGTRRRRR
jgi:hypothetical protein